MTLPATSPHARSLPLGLALLTLLTACPPRATLDDSGQGWVDPSSTAGDGGAGSVTAGPQSTAVMTTVSMDYATGSLATVDLDTWTISDELTTTTGDAAVTVTGDWVIQLNRYGYDSVRLYRPGSWQAPELEVSVADADGSTNPQDAAICDDKLFITLYERDHVAVLDPTSGSLIGSVDLSAYDDADSTGPEPSGMVQRDGKLYVALERLDRDKGWVDAGGKIVEVDCATQTALRTWDVAGNTRVYDWADHDQVLVGARAYGDAAGGLYVLDPAKDTVELVAEIGATSGTEAATLSGAGAFGDHAIITTLSDDLASYGIHCVDLTTGTVTDLDHRSEFLQGVSVNDRGQAWIAATWGWTDPDAASPGLFIYDIETCTALTGDAPLALSLAPSSVAFY